MGFFFFLRFHLFILERGKGKEKEGEKHQCVVASHMPPTGDPACNPRICLDWELNWRSQFTEHFGSQPVLSPLSYTSQGYSMVLVNKHLNIKTVN